MWTSSSCMDVIKKFNQTRICVYKFHKNILLPLWFFVGIFFFTKFYRSEKRYRQTIDFLKISVERIVVLWFVYMIWWDEWDFYNFRKSTASARMQKELDYIGISLNNIMPSSDVNNKQHENEQPIRLKWTANWLWTRWNTEKTKTKRSFMFLCIFMSRNVSNSCKINGVKFVNFNLFVVVICLKSILVLWNF